jgi:hypothetical protein
MIQKRLRHNVARVRELEALCRKLISILEYHDDKWNLNKEQQNILKESRSVLGE